MHPWLIIISVILISSCGSRFSRSGLAEESAETPAENPVPFTLHGSGLSGLFNKEVVDRHTASGDAAVVRRGYGGFKVQHLRYEVYENSKFSANELGTQFAFVEATYITAMDNIGTADILSKLDLHVLHLDGFGKPSDRFITISFKESLKEERSVWRKTVREGGSRARFYEILPQFARARLWQVTGFLNKNTGRPVVGFKVTDSDTVKLILKLALSFSPRIVEGAAGRVVESLARHTAKRGVDAAFKNSDLRMGVGFLVEDDLAAQYANEYMSIGQTLWEEIIR